MRQEATKNRKEVVQVRFDDLPISANTTLTSWTADEPSIFKWSKALIKLFSSFGIHSQLRTHPFRRTIFLPSNLLQLPISSLHSRMEDQEEE